MPSRTASAAPATRSPASSGAPFWRSPPSCSPPATDAAGPAPTHGCDVPAPQRRPRRMGLPTPDPRPARRHPPPTTPRGRSHPAQPATHHGQRPGCLRGRRRDPRRHRRHEHRPRPTPSRAPPPSKQWPRQPPSAHPHRAFPLRSGSPSSSSPTPPSRCSSLRSDASTWSTCPEPDRGVRPGVVEPMHPGRGLTFRLGPAGPGSVVAVDEFSRETARSSIPRVRCPGRRLSQQRRVPPHAQGRNRAWMRPTR